MSNTLYIPLQFWFCRDPGLALPLIALQYHEVKINCTLAKPTDSTPSSPSFKNVQLYLDYVYLDVDERRRFAQVSHEYLIEQTQHAVIGRSMQNSVSLNLNHPVKCLVWTHKKDVENDDKMTATLVLNGHERFSPRQASYFRLVQPYQHFPNVPEQQTANADTQTYVYSFGLKPAEHQPSGTCNMSRIDNCEMRFDGYTPKTTATTDGDGATVPSVPYTLDAYAVNYNVLRIMSGMGGLQYSN